MTTARKKGIPIWMAVAMASYLMLSLGCLVFDIGPAGMLFVPAIYMLIAPTPVLATVGLAETSWLISLPTIPGIVLLVSLYTTVVYVVAKCAVGMMQRD